MTKKNSELKRISGLWSNELPSGDSYLSGSNITSETFVGSEEEKERVLDILLDTIEAIEAGKKYKFVIFPNNYKEEDKHPDYNLCIAEVIPKEKLETKKCTPKKKTK